MEIIDANAGLLSNFEVYQYLADKERNNYPSYDTFVGALEAQKEREFTSSFLSAREAKQRLADEQAEKELEQFEQKTSDAGSSTPAASPVQPVDGVIDGRDLKPLEGTVWMKSKVLQYLTNTPAATQTSESVAKFIIEAKALLKERAGDNQTKEEDTRLTVCELIQLVNLRPASLVEIHRAIEECEERFSEDDTLALLDLIERTLPKAPPRLGAQVAEEQLDDGLAPMQQ